MDPGSEYKEMQSNIDIWKPVTITLTVFSTGVTYLSIAVGLSLLINVIIIITLIVIILTFISIMLFKRHKQTVIKYNLLLDDYKHVIKNRNTLTKMYEKTTDELKFKNRELHFTQAQLSFLLQIWNSDKKPDRKVVQEKLNIKEIEVEFNEENSNHKNN